MTAPHNVLQGVLHRLSSAVEELNSDGALNLPSLKLLLGNSPASEIPAGKIPVQKLPAAKLPVVLKLPAWIIPALKLPDLKHPASIVPAQKRPASNLPVPKLPPTKLPASMLCQIRQRYPNLRHRKKFLPYPLPNLPCLTHRLTSRQQHLPLVPC